MIRSHLVLAVTGISILLASFATGMAAAAETPGPSAAWHGVHLLVSVGGSIAILGIHSIVYTYFIATTRWTREVARIRGLPERFVAHARRNKVRASRFVLGGVAAVAGAAWLGAAADTRGGGYAPWHLAASSFAVGFNVVAFVIEYAGVVAHHRLLAEVKLRAEGVRGGDSRARDGSGI